MLLWVLSPLIPVFLLLFAFTQPTQCSSCISGNQERNQATPEQHGRRTRCSLSRAVNSRYLVGTGRTTALRHLVGQFPGTQRARFPNHLNAHVHFLRFKHSSASSQGCRPGSNTPQRAQDTDPKGAEMEPASLLRNLIFTAQLRADSSVFKVFLSGVSS